MTLNEYQAYALSTAVDKNNELFHRVLGLVGEAGEIAEKIKKLVRDHNSDLEKLDTLDIAKELGDTLWYVATLADFLGYSLDTVAEMNIKKLEDRKNRNVLQGSGDNR
ncbi:MAG: nucleoside triphosphate pyrophosphohydrolase family protein [Candidatus Saccharimonadales bacterium]